MSGYVLTRRYDHRLLRLKMSLGKKLKWGYPRHLASMKIKSKSGLLRKVLSKLFALFKIFIESKFKK